jgi:hypothetical protein
VELNVGVFGLHALRGRGASEHGFWDLVHLIVEILDLDMDSIIYDLFRANWDNVQLVDVPVSYTTSNVRSLRSVP